MPLGQSSGQPPSSSREKITPPVSTSSMEFRRVIRLVPPNEGCRLPSRIGAPPVASWLTPNVGDLPPSLHGHYPASSLLRSSPPYPPHRYFRPRSVAACTFSLGIAGQVLKFRTRARTRVMPPIHRAPRGQ